MTFEIWDFFDSLLTPAEETLPGVLFALVGGGVSDSLRAALCAVARLHAPAGAARRPVQYGFEGVFDGRTCRAES